MKRVLMTAVICVGFVGALSAQYNRPYYNRYYGGGSIHAYSSTAAEGAAYGMAEMTRAQGQYNMMTAQAAVTGQQAYSAALDNKLKATQTYFEMRRINQEATAAERNARKQQSYGSPALAAR